MLQRTIAARLDFDIVDREAELRHRPMRCGGSNQEAPDQDVFIAIGINGTTPHRTAHFKDVQIPKLDPAAKQEP
jgi:hypothetical protein